MRATLSLIKREFAAYFISPTAYVTTAFFLLVVGGLFCLVLDLLTIPGTAGTEYPLQSLLGDERFWLIFLFIPPVLTMRSFAEERSTGTLEVLMTAPIRDWQVVAGKFIAAFLFYVVLWLPTLIYLPVLLDLKITNWSLLRTDPTPKMLVNGLLFLLVCGIGLLCADSRSRFFAIAFTAFGIIVPLSIYLLNKINPDDNLQSMITIIGLQVLVFVLAFLFSRAFGFTGFEGWGNVVTWMYAAVTLLAVCVAAYLRTEYQGPKALVAGIDPWPAVTSYIGILLAGAMFIAIGLFVSSLVKNQLVAAMIAFALGLVFIVTAFWKPGFDPDSILARLVQYVSVPDHFRRDFTRGVIDTRNLALYLTLTAFCLFLTVRSLEARRLR